MKKKEKTSSSQEKSGMVNVKGAAKSAVNFNPVLGSPTDLPTDTGQTPAADTLKPFSSDQKQGNIAENVASITTRRKRANQMKRLSGKLSRLRNVAMNQLAPEKRLKRRSQKMARNLIRGRFAGSRGRNYSNLSTSDKIAVDSMLQNKQKMIARIAQRLMPVVRRADAIRVANVRKPKKNKRFSKTGYLGYMPKNPPTRAEDYARKADLISENITYCILEGKTEKLDQLLRSGLADRNSIAQYKKALADPEFAKRYSVLRDKAFDILEKLVDTITGDPTIFVRTKDNIQKKYDFNRKNMKESVDLVEGRKSKAEIARIEQAKKDNRTLLTTVGSARSMKRTIGGKSPMKTVSAKEKPMKDVVRSTASSAVQVTRQLRTQQAAKKDQGMKLGPIKLNAVSSSAVTPAQASIAVTFNKPPTKKPSTVLPAVTIPAPTPAQQTLRPRSKPATTKKPGLINKLFSKFGRFVDRKATDMFDLDDRKAKLTKIKKDSAFRAALLTTKSEADREVSMARDDSDISRMRRKGGSKVLKHLARGEVQTSMMRAKAKRKGQKAQTQMDIDTLNMSTDIAKMFNNSKIEAQKQQLLSLHDKMNHLITLRQKGQLNDTDYEHHMIKLQGAFHKIKKWPLNFKADMLSNMNEEVNLPDHLRDPKKHPSQRTAEETHKRHKKFQQASDRIKNKSNEREDMNENKKRQHEMRLARIKQSVSNFQSKPKPKKLKLAKKKVAKR